jgi:hypothetical protein
MCFQMTINWAAPNKRSVLPHRSFTLIRSSTSVWPI